MINEKERGIIVIGAGVGKQVRIANELHHPPIIIASKETPPNPAFVDKVDFEIKQLMAHPTYGYPSGKENRRERRRKNRKK